VWHVGLLYRSLDLLELLAIEPVLTTDLYNKPGYFREVKTELLIQVVTTGGWSQETSDLALQVTENGRELLSQSETDIRLRHLIMTLVEQQLPTWASASVMGRGAVKKYASPEVLQCLRESGLFDSSEQDVINWWDKIAGWFRGQRDEARTETGRRGERLSFNFEEKRIGHAPVWTALEHASAGYDLLSSVSSSDFTPLLIEVKSSRLRWNEAVFFLTRNEWNVLSRESSSILHIWSLASCPEMLSVVSLADLGVHIPEDCGDSQWQTLMCPYLAFQPM